MLQTLRNNMKGPMAMLIVGIMIVPFAFFGVDSLFSQDSSAGKAAEVNGSVISEMELARAVQSQKQQLLQRFGNQAPAELLSDDNLRAPALERLIQRQVLSDTARDGGMAVSDQILDQVIVDIPQFQRDGRFSPELYMQLLRNRGYTPVTYKALLREDLIVNQLVAGVAGSAFATQDDIDTLVALTQQERSFFYLTIPFASVVEQVQVSDTEVEAFYHDNQVSFMSRDQVIVESVTLSLADLASATSVSDTEIEAQYQQDIANFDAKVQRHAAHILIEDKDNAEVLIAEIEEKLASGEEFSALVQQYSDDLGSKESGGDVGVTDGTTFPVEFESALADLDVGSVSEAVITDAGTHFIKLIGVQSTEPATLAESREAIESSLARAEAESVYFELLEELPDATYNSSDLESAVESLGLTASVSEPISRDGGVGVLSNNQVLAAIFSDELLKEGLTSDIIEVADDEVIVVRVKEFFPSKLKELAQVSEDIKETLIRQGAETLLTQQADAYIQQLQQGKSIETLATEHALEWQVSANTQRSDSTIERDLLQRVFELPKPVDVGVNSGLVLSNGDYVVMQLTVVKAGKLPEMEESEKLAIMRNYGSQLGEVEFSTYQESLQSRATIDIY